MGGGFSESKSRTVVPREFKNLRDPVANSLRGLIAGGPQFEGPFTADLTGREIENLDFLNEQATNPSALALAGRGALQETAEGRFLRPESNPFLRDTIAGAQRSVIEAFRENNLLDRASFTNAGQTLSDSSPFARAQALESRGLANALGDIATNISSQNFQSERDRQISAAESGDVVTQREFDRSLQNLQAQALPRLIEQFGIDQGLEEFRRRVALIAQSTSDAGALSISGPQRASSFGVNLALGS